jgi:hypothetical protein
MYLKKENWGITVQQTIPYRRLTARTGPVRNVAVAQFRSRQRVLNDARDFFRGEREGTYFGALRRSLTRLIETCERAVVQRAEQQAEYDARVQAPPVAREPDEVIAAQNEIHALAMKDAYWSDADYARLDMCNRTIRNFHNKRQADFQKAIAQ